MNGKIPDSIVYLKKLRTLIISSNKFSGMIPEIPGLLCYLTHFTSNKNQLTGNIHVQLANLTGLQFLDLSYNWLNGSIP
jgi:Leucine-rich repeat (LRR) protein